MKTIFATKRDAIAAGFRPVNPQEDRDISGYPYFGYAYENSDGEQTVDVWLTEEKNKAGTLGCGLPMYPPKAAAVLGRLGGSKTSEAKARASRENGRKGGRPYALPLRYEVVEDNAGGLYIAILNRRGRCIGLFANFEYQPPDSLISCIDALDDGSDFDDWEGAIDNPTEEYNRMMDRQPYGYRIICANYGDGRKIYPERMGRNGQIAFGIDYD